MSPTFSQAIAYSNTSDVELWYLEPYLVLQVVHNLADKRLLHSFKRSPVLNHYHTQGYWFQLVNLGPMILSRPNISRISFHGMSIIAFNAQNPTNSRTCHKVRVHTLSALSALTFFSSHQSARQVVG